MLLLKKRKKYLCYHCEDCHNNGQRQKHKFQANHDVKTVVKFLTYPETNNMFILMFNNHLGKEILYIKLKYLS